MITMLSFSDSGQKNINKNLYEAISSVNYEHIGEVFLNNIENDGSMLGFDVNVIKEVEKRIERPIIILGEVEIGCIFRCFF